MDSISTTRRVDDEFSMGKSFTCSSCLSVTSDELIDKASKAWMTSHLLE